MMNALTGLLRNSFITVNGGGEIKPNINIVFDSLTNAHEAHRLIIQLRNSTVDKDARISALESLLARASEELYLHTHFHGVQFENARIVLEEIDAILPATEAAEK